MSETHNTEPEDDELESNWKVTLMWVVLYGLIPLILPISITLWVAGWLVSRLETSSYTPHGMYTLREEIRGETSHSKLLVFTYGPFLLIGPQISEDLRKWYYGYEEYWRR